MIKKIIAYVPCHVCYYIGDRISILLNTIPNKESKFYDLLASWGYKWYNGFMLWSVWWNDFGNLNVWKEPPTNS